mgnify:CR=1 FL=1
MKKRSALVGVAALLIVLGGAAWLNRKEVILWLVTTLAKDRDIAPYSPVAWNEGPPSAPAGDRPPNIVFILADDLGINDISAFGGGVAGGRVPTPNIDRLAKEGALFAQAYAGTASCAPSRAMILTGRYPTRTGFEFTPTPDGMGRMVAMFSDNERSGLPPVDWNRDADDKVPSFDEQGLPGSEITIAEILKGAGYHTVHIGKWHLGSGKEFGANAQGFDESLLMASGLHLPEDNPGVINAKLDFDPIDRFLWARMQYAASFNEGPLFAPGGYLADYWTDEAVKVIRANRNRPFFLYLAHWGVHTPLQATRADYEAVGDIKPHRLRVYAAMVRSLDRSVGRVLATLKDEGLDENTIVVFSSDNGGAGYVGLPDINAPYRGWKLTMFEGGIRVPLFMRWPARIAPGTRIEKPAGHIDLMPTFAAAAGAPLPAGVAIDGVNLLESETPARADDALFWQSAYYRVVRQGDWKLQVTERPKKAWLFDLAADPTEKVNLAEREPARVAAMTALLDAHRKAGRAPLYPHTIEAPVAIDKTLAERARPRDEFIYWPN